MSVTLYFSLLLQDEQVITATEDAYNFNMTVRHNLCRFSIRKCFSYAVSKITDSYDLVVAQT